MGNKSSNLRSNFSMKELFLSGLWVVNTFSIGVGWDIGTVSYMDGCEDIRVFQHIPNTAICVLWVEHSWGMRVAFSLDMAIASNLVEYIGDLVSLSLVLGSSGSIDY